MPQDKKKNLPRHVAIIMDGNGRWAKKRFLPRVAGHVKGVELLREMVRACLERGGVTFAATTFRTEVGRVEPDELSAEFGDLGGRCRCHAAILPHPLTQIAITPGRCYSYRAAEAHLVRMAE